MHALKLFYSASESLRPPSCWSTLLSWTHHIIHIIIICRCERKKEKRCCFDWLQVVSAVMDGMLLVRLNADSVGFFAPDHCNNTLLLQHEDGAIINPQEWTKSKANTHTRSPRQDYWSPGCLASWFKGGPGRPRCWPYLSNFSQIVQRRPNTTTTLPGTVNLNWQ